MKCGGCVASIEKAIHAVDASATVRADIEARSINVTTSSDRQVLLTALDAAGYPAKAD
ncbi:Heavy-metal-associated domain protein [compost metagenome]